MKVDAVMKTVVEAMAEKIDRLRSEVFVRDMEIEKLKEANEEIRKQRDALCRGEAIDGEL